MNFKKIAVIAALGAASSVAFAADHTGFSIGAEMQFKSTGGDLSYKDSGSGGYSSGSLGGENNVIGAINASYGIAVAPKVILQVGATYDLNKTDIYKDKYSDSTSSGSTKVDEKDHYSVYIAPGFLVAPSTLVYGKLAYHSMKASLNAYDSLDGTLKGNKTFTGYGYGAGIRTSFTSNIYAYAEVQRVQYESKTIASAGTTLKVSAEPTSTIGSIGVGYNF